VPSENNNIKRRGIMVALSSPSGAGKTTISRMILENDKQLSLSVSYTTRPKRANEQEGVDYHFTDQDTFKKMIDQDEFLEYAKVFDQYYGTPKKAVEEALENGKDILFDIDWQGTQQISEKASEDIVSIFILPPSCKELERRLRSRGRDPEDVIKHRMSKAADEMSHWAEYHYVIVNNAIEESVAKVESIILAERLMRRRQIGLSSFVTNLMSELD
jgi:guanylate kinase